MIKCSINALMWYFNTNSTKKAFEILRRIKNNVEWQNEIEQRYKEYTHSLFMND